MIRTQDVVDLWPTSRGAANATLSRMARKGWLQRLKRGSYAVIALGSGTSTPAIAAAWPVAAELFAPCFISGWSAAEHWGLTDQIFNTVALVTTHPQRARDQRIGGIRFRVRTLPPKRAFGTVGIWLGSARVQVADAHRTIIDILDDPAFGGGGRHVLDIVKNYWTGSLCDPETLLSYAVRFGRGTVFKRLGFTADHYGDPSDEWLQACRRGRSHGISLLDPASPSAGRIATRWGVRVNLPMDAR